MAGVNWSDDAEWTQAELEVALDKIENLRKLRWTYREIAARYGISTDRSYKLGEMVVARRRRKARIFEHFSERRSLF